MDRNYLTAILQELENSGLAMTRLSVLSKVPAYQLYRMRDNKRPCSIESAIKLEIATDGKIKAQKIDPEFFLLLEKLGFERKSAA